MQPSKHKTQKMLAQRLRRWANILHMLYKCFVFAGKAIASVVWYLYVGQKLLTFMC